MASTSRSLIRRSLLPLAALCLVITGCGTNSTTGLQSITLEPDLQIDDIEAPASVVSSQAWSVRVTVANRGGVDANGFTVEIEVFSGGLRSRGETLVATGLSASDVVEVEVDMSPIAVTTLSVFTGDVTVDADSTVLESNETNNTGNFTITVTPPGSSGDGIPTGT